MEPENKDRDQTLPSYSEQQLLELLRVCNRNRVTECLFKKRESRGILSLKAHLLTWAGCSSFTSFKYHMTVLAAVPLRYRGVSEDQAARIGRSDLPWLFPICPLLFAWLLSLGKQPRQIYVSLLTYIPDNKSEVDI